ncbi:MAG: hypothetical protein ACRD0X_02365 [Thermoanaerobaculia bacterium]
MTVKQSPPPLSEFEAGFLVGVLVGEGHFGGDGRQPQVTLRMHTDHVALFEWLARRCGGRLYGPYHHGGRSYYQWMARGAYLRERLVPLLDRLLTAELDGKAHARYLEMKRRYGLAPAAAGGGELSPAAAPAGPGRA